MVFVCLHFDHQPSSLKRKHHLILIFLIQLKNSQVARIDQLPSELSEHREDALVRALPMGYNEDSEEKSSAGEVD